MSTVPEIKVAIEALSPDQRTELTHWLQEIHPPLDPELDTPELEAELLKAADKPFTPYAADEMQELGEHIIREKRQK